MISVPFNCLFISQGIILKRRLSSAYQLPEAVQIYLLTRYLLGHEL